MRNENQNNNDSSFRDDLYDQKRDRYQNQSHRDDTMDGFDQSYRTTRTPSPESSYLQGSRPYNSSDSNFRRHGMNENTGGRGTYPEQYGNQYQDDFKKNSQNFSQGQNYTGRQGQYGKSQGDLDSDYYQDRYQRNYGLSSNDREEGYFDDYDRASHGFRGKGPKGYERSDERIREDVCEKLMDSHYINAENIEVKVNKGCVTLSGHVDNKRVKYFVEDIAESASGVKEVQNHISLRKKDYTDTDTNNIHQNQ